MCRGQSVLLTAAALALNRRDINEIRDRDTYFVSRHSAKPRRENVLLIFRIAFNSRTLRSIRFACRLLNNIARAWWKVNACLPFNCVSALPGTGIRIETRDTCARGYDEKNTFKFQL